MIIGDGAWSRANWSGWNNIPGTTFPPGAQLAGANGVYAAATDGYTRANDLPNSGWYRVN